MREDTSQLRFDNQTGKITKSERYENQKAEKQLGGLTDGDWIEFDLGETSFAILKRPAHKGDVVASKTRLMFETDDIELVYEELKNRGVKTIGEIRTEPYGKLLTFEDPDGHWLEFYQRPKPVKT